jgi:hypothetical protein
MDEMMMEFGLSTKKIVSTSENRKNRLLVIDEWQLGPEKASVDPKANKEYWTSLGKAWGMNEKEARRRLCANCEYFQNDPMMQAKMEAIPLDKFDMDGGGRGYCEKFDFICHNLRACQAWEEDD